MSQSKARPDSPRKYRMAAACRIIGADRLRLSEALSSGAFDWPIEVKGNNRLFEEKDLVATWLFYAGLRLGHSPKMANWLVSRFGQIIEALYQEKGYWRDRISAKQRDSSLLLAIGVSGKTTVGWACDRAKFELPNGEKIVQWIEIDLEPIRELIRAGIEAEDRTSGEDEDDSSAAKATDEALTRIFMPSEKPKGSARTH